MTVYIDVLLARKMTEIIKHVYYTVIYHCDQSMEDTLCISENVLKEMKKDNPDINMILMKSDNASCYHGNHSAEISHLICKQQNVKLLSYNFNEPSKGKNLCDLGRLHPKKAYCDHILMQEYISWVALCEQIKKFYCLCC